MLRRAVSGRHGKVSAHLRRVARWREYCNLQREDLQQPPDATIRAKE